MSYCDTSDFNCVCSPIDSLITILNRVVNIAATAMVTEAATALFGEAGVTAATGVMTVGDSRFFVSRLAFNYKYVSRICGTSC